MRSKSLIRGLALSAAGVGALATSVNNNNNIQSHAAGCNRVSLDFSNDTCNNITDFNEAFRSLYQEINLYLDGPPTINLGSSSYELVHEKVISNGMSVRSNGGDAYSVVQGDHDRRQRQLRRRKEKRDLAIWFNCPPKEECFEDWCCMICGVHCVALNSVPTPDNNNAQGSGNNNSTSSPTSSPTTNNVCEYVETIQLEECLEGAEVVCTVP